MATFKSNTGNGYQLRLSVVTNSQDKDDNTSTLGWTLSISNGSTYFNAKMTGECKIDGSTVWSADSESFNSSPSGSVKVIKNGTKTVSHNTDGTKNVSVSANLKTDTQGASWSVPQLSLSGTYSPPDIPRVPSAPAAPSVTRDQDARRLIITSKVPASGVTPTAYQCRVRQSGSGTWTTYDMVLSTRALTYNPPSVEPTSFEFQTRAYGAGSWSGWSGTTTHTPAWIPTQLGDVAYTTSRVDMMVEVTAPVANAGGTPILKYQIAVRRMLSSGDWSPTATYTANLSTRKVSWTAPEAGVLYEAKARAQTSAGWSPYQDAWTSFYGPGSGPSINVDGVWHKADAWMNQWGVWQRVIVWVKVDGEWTMVR